MKPMNVLFITLFATVLFTFANLEKRVNLNATAQTDTPSNGTSGLPLFLEKGKIYNFTFAVNQSDYNANIQATLSSPLSITGRIEKIDPQSTWLYINLVSPGKNVAWRSNGYSWINFNQVYQCSEIKNLP